MIGAQAHILPDGQRLHLHHGPIDLIIGASGHGVDAAYSRATARFERVLDELVCELPDLRKPLGQKRFQGWVAQRMAQAVAPFREVFVTPMAAVAGAVADEIRACLWADGLEKAYVNNGGDIAFRVEGRAVFRCVGAGGAMALRADDPVRGIATSGWRGRSHSLGIADAVTVLAGCAAQADVAATLIANAVDLPGHRGITRVPASALSPDSDLGARLVTTGVAHLPKADVSLALSRGLAMAQRFAAAGLIQDAILSLQDETRSVAQTPRLSPAIASRQAPRQAPEGAFTDA